MNTPQKPAPTPSEPDTTKRPALRPPKSPHFDEDILPTDPPDILPTDPPDPPPPPPPTS